MSEKPKTNHEKYLNLFFIKKYRLNYKTGGYRDKIRQKEQSITIRFDSILKYNLTLILLNFRT